MKLKKTRLRKIISEELVRVLMEVESKRVSSINESKKPSGNTPDTLSDIVRYANVITEAASKSVSMDIWATAKISKALASLQEVSEHIQCEALLEGMDPAMDSPRMDTDHTTTDTLGLMDPHSTDAGTDSWFNNIQVASRILEDLPLEELPDQATDAARMLRNTLDVMTNPLVQEKA